MTDGMSAEPPSARFQMVHQPQRPADAKRSSMGVTSLEQTASEETATR